MIYCCGCQRDVTARLTNGKEIYPHREDLHGLPFWICDTCKNYVGCHHKTANPTTPLGHISTPAIKMIRQEVHKWIDPLWKDGKAPRAKVYAMMTARIGKTYHTAEIKSESEGMEILTIAKQLAKELRS